MAEKRSVFERLDELTAFDYEFWSKGYMILGMDESGRGPLAGPVVAAGVVMQNDNFIYGIDDSKKISEKKREELFEIIVSEAVSIGIGIIENDEIDRINILNAARLAFEKAYRESSVKPEIVLTDYITGLEIEGYRAIKKGDSVSYSIAAASIVAKVTRDRIMREYDEEFPEYGFSRHKGYGTKAHIEAIKRFGACRVHRLSFLKNIL